MFQCFRVLDQHTGLSAAADADHDRHWRRKTKSTRASDDENGNGRDETIRQPRLGTPDAPRQEGYNSNDDHRRYEPARDLIGEPLDRCAATLRLRHHLHDLRKYCFSCRRALHAS